MIRLLNAGISFVGPPEHVIFYTSVRTALILQTVLPSSQKLDHSAIGPKWNPTQPPSTEACSEVVLFLLNLLWPTCIGDQERCIRQEIAGT